AVLYRDRHAAAKLERHIAFPASRPPLGRQVREDLDLRLHLLDFRLKFRADFLEPPLRLHAVDGRPLEALLRATDLRAIARFDLSKPLQLPIGFLLGRNSDTSVSSAQMTGFR